MTDHKGNPRISRRLSRAVQLGALAMAACVAPLAAQAECQLIQLSDMPLTMRGAAPLLDVEINGSPVRLLVDSGATWSNLTTAKAQELGLRTYAPSSGLRVRGIGGSTSAQLTRVKSFRFAEWDLENVEFFVFAMPVADGTLGQNILDLVEVEYDFSKGRMRFFHGEDCRNSMLAYWAGDRAWSVVDLEEFALAPDMTTAYAEVNGERMRVLIDTGASATILSERAARRAGIDLDHPEVEEGGALGGVGRSTRRTWVVRLDTFKLGDQEVSNPPVRVVDANLRVDMILGTDFLSSHRVLVSNDQKKMYFTYEGGPIFNSEADAYVLMDDGELVDHDADDGGELEGADAFASRGAARLAQGQSADAVADYDEAIRLDPENASYYLQRSRARIPLEQFEESWDDLQRAIDLEPDNAEALILRARLTFLRDPDSEDAFADAMAASRAVAPQSNLRMQLGEVMTTLGRMDQAIVEYSQWLEAHRQDVRRPLALNGRCWARGLANVDLDDALDDCNEAVRRGPDTAAFLDSRGMVRLRRGEYERAIEDYSRALEIEETLAFSFYGRSMARRALGQTAQADADLAAAKAVRASVVEDAARYGF